MSDEQRALPRRVIDRRRVLRAGGLATLALASAGLLTACPVVGDDDDDDGGDDGGGDSGDDGGDDDSDDD